MCCILSFLFVAVGINNRQIGQLTGTGGPLAGEPADDLEVPIPVPPVTPGPQVILGAGLSLKATCPVFGDQLKPFTKIRRARINLSGKIQTIVRLSCNIGDCRL
jgi:hypothetical protein